MKSFTMVPNWLLDDETISRSELLVLIALAHFYYQGTGAVFPSHRTIGQRARLSKSAVKTTLQSLRDKELIDWDERRSDRVATSHLYHLHFLTRSQMTGGGSLADPPWVTGCPRGGSMAGYEEDPLEEDAMKKMVWSSPQAATTPRCFASHDNDALVYVLDCLTAVAGLEDLDLSAVHDILDGYAIRHPDAWVDSLRAMPEAQILSWLSPYVAEESEA